jgi:hypothetical protein
LLGVTGSIKVKDTDKSVEMEEAFVETKIDDEYMPCVILLILNPLFKRKFL